MLPQQIHRLNAHIAFSRVAPDVPHLLAAFGRLSLMGFSQCMAVEALLLKHESVCRGVPAEARETHPLVEVNRARVAAALEGVIATLPQPLDTLQG